MYCIFARSIARAVLNAKFNPGGKDKQVMAHLEGFR